MEIITITNPVEIQVLLGHYEVLGYEFLPGVNPDVPYLGWEISEETKTIRPTQEAGLRLLRLP